MTPVFQTVFVTEDSKVGNCQAACMASILDLPLDQVIDTACPEMRDNGFWPSIYKWCSDNGYEYMHLSKTDERVKNAYTIGVGDSPRGPFQHGVVCWDGEIVHDPHPSGAGLLKINRYDMIVKKSD